MTFTLAFFSILQIRDMELLPVGGGAQLVFLSCSSTSRRTVKLWTRMTFLATGVLAMLFSSSRLTPLPMPSTTTFVSLFSLSASVCICGLNDTHHTVYETYKFILFSSACVRVWERVVSWRHFSTNKATRCHYYSMCGKRHQVDKYNLTQEGYLPQTDRASAFAVDRVKYSTSSLITMQNLAVFFSYSVRAFRGPKMWGRRGPTSCDWCN